MLNRTAALPPFVSRSRELALLENLWASPRAELLILYGRRRVGKTRLLTRWIETAQPRALYWVAEPTSSLDQLRSFSQALYNFANPGAPAPDGFAYASWGQVFQQIAALAASQRAAIILDEFTYLLSSEPGIAGVLQNAWDHALSQANLLLVLSGSHIGMMERHLLAYQAPLYGRATARLRLDALPFSATRSYFPGYSAEERVALYAMLGGIPGYWERFETGQSLDANLRQQFLSPSNLLQDEPRLLLQDFITDPHNYVAILRAIAHNARTPKEIANFTGLEEKHVPAYLVKLLDTGFVERRTPVTLPASTRLGRHFISDAFLRFYYRFLSRRQAQLALGLQDPAMNEIQRHLQDFIGSHTWEELCREWTLRAAAAGELPFLPDQVGSAWTKQAQVDVAGVNFMEKTLILGECKWSQSPLDRSVLRELVEKTALVIPAEGSWRVFYLGFARRGFTPAAQAYAASLPPESSGGPNWSAAGMRLVDLTQVDDDLAKWSG